MVSGKATGSVELVRDREPRRGSIGHPHRDRTVQIDDGGRVHARQLAIEHRDLGPVGLVGASRRRVTRRDRRLHLVRTGLTAPQRAVQHRQPLGDLAGVPCRPVLIVEGDELALVIDSCRSPRVVQQHQREQPQRFRLVGHQPRQHPTEPDRLGAQVGPHERGASRRGVPLVEEQVDHAEQRARPLRQDVVGRHAERDPA